MDTTQVLILQAISCIVLFLEYIPQILKTVKRKSAEDMSIIYWICKLVYTSISIYILFITGNIFLVIFAQIVSFGLAFTEFYLIIYYKKLKGDN